MDAKERAHEVLKLARFHYPLGSTLVSVIAEALLAAEREAMEKAAKIAQDWEPPWCHDGEHELIQKNIAAEIRRFAAEATRPGEGSGIAE